MESSGSAASGAGSAARSQFTNAELIVTVLLPLLLYCGGVMQFTRWIDDVELLSLVGLILCAFLLGMPLIFFSLRALFRRRWKKLFVFAIVWFLVCSPLFITGSPMSSSLALGFFIRTQLAGDYLSKCDLKHFSKHGVEQAGGACEWFDRGNVFDEIFYDTTGEFMLPSSQRSAEWKQAITLDEINPVEAEKYQARHLFGNYYYISIPIGDIAG